MGSIYLIDFENVGNKWADVMTGAGSGDTAVLFYSDNSPKAMLGQMERVERRGVAIKFRHCEPGRNGLDFQLASELGFLAGKGQPGPYYILSDDSGYDVLAKYWAASGVTVRRVGSTGTGMPGASRQQMYDALEPAMSQAGLTKHERSHVLGCARACLDKLSDPDARMAKFRSDTAKFKGRRLLEKIDQAMAGALMDLFRQ